MSVLGLLLSALFVGFLAFATTCVRIIAINTERAEKRFRIMEEELGRLERKVDAAERKTGQWAAELGAAMVVVRQAVGENGKRMQAIEKHDILRRLDKLEQRPAPMSSEAMDQLRSRLMKNVDSDFWREDQ
jgi:hypothetical protein